MHVDCEGNRIRLSTCKSWDRDRNHVRLSQLRECLAGPRRPGEGIEDEAQGIVDVQETASG